MKKGIFIPNKIKIPKKPKPISFNNRSSKPVTRKQ